MVSPDGLDWVTANNVDANAWRMVCWAEELGLFCAVADSGTNNKRVMTSDDGLNWTATTPPVINTWRAVCYSPELREFCSVSDNGTGDRVMTTSEDNVKINGPVNMSNNRITSVANPIDPQDVATKNYTDTKVAPYIFSAHRSAQRLTSDNNTSDPNTAITITGTHKIVSISGSLRNCGTTTTENVYVYPMGIFMHNSGTYGYSNWYYTGYTSTRGTTTYYLRSQSGGGSVPGGLSWVIEYTR